MNLVTCRLCGKLFNAARGKTCVACLEEVDRLYPKVREYLRDHTKEVCNLERVSEDMGIDIRYVQALVELGYLDRAVQDETEAEEEKLRKQILVRELQASLDTSPLRKNEQLAGKMYSQKRYGTARKTDS